jgi:hypothetical protein
VEAGLVGSTKLENGTTILNECTLSTLEGEIAKNGSETEPFTVKVKKWTWGGCTVLTNTLVGGTLSVDSINGSEDGTVTASATEITVTIGGASCIYGTGVSIDLGTLVSGENPHIVISTKLKKVSGGLICPAEPTLTAEYKVTSPTAPLYVEPK